MKKRQSSKQRVVCILSIWMMLISAIIPVDLTYVIFKQPRVMAASVSSAENEEKVVQTVHQVVIFIRFANEGEDIYESRGGYDYIKSLYDGPEKSLNAYMDEYSWGQVQVKTHFLPMDANGTPICYVDPYPASYYLIKSDSNPDGYETANKGTRRSTLLKNALKFVGEDFEQKLGIEDQLYNIVFMVPDRGSWNHLLWSHKSSITVNGKSRTYNMITYPSKSDISKTITHEFMHSLGYKDMYHSSSGTNPEPVGMWSLMASTSANAGHPFVHEKNRYGKWLEGTNAIKIVRKSGHYELGPSTADPKKNTIALKIPVEGTETQFFMVEYRGSSESGSDKDLKKEGLVFYRVNTAKSGNFSGPPDEIFVLREDGKGVSTGYFDGSAGKTEWGKFQLYGDTTDLGIKVSNIKKEDGFMSFDISMSYQYMDGTSVTDLKATGSSPQRVGTELTFTATVEKEAISEKSIYEYTVEKDGKIQKLSMTDDFTANWKPSEPGSYTITYTVTDAEGIVSCKKLQYLIGTDTTAYVLYYTTWQQPYIHYQIGTGQWTTAPGQKMIACNIQGYKWIYMIELGTASGKANLCFNNGNGTWDSKNETNYSVEVGCYGIKNSTLTKIQDTSVITPVVTLVPTTTVAPTVVPTVTPTAIVTVTPRPTVTPTAIATTTPTVKPTVSPTIKPTVTPTIRPTVTPTIKPTVSSTIRPTVTPTAVPTETPKITETPKVTIVPTVTPTFVVPTEMPLSTQEPTMLPKATDVPKVGESVYDEQTKATYTITSSEGKKTVEYVASNNSGDTVTIPDKVNIKGEVFTLTTVSDDAFKNNKTVKTVNIGKNVTVIGKDAFKNCTSLQVVKGGAKLTKIGKNAFYGCIRLQKVTFGTKLKSIGNYAFYGCKSLKSISIPSKVTSIGTKAFYGCKSLKSITIKTKKLNQKNVGAKAFYGIYAKVVVKVPESKTKTYKNLLRAKGISAKVKISKIK